MRRRVPGLLGILLVVVVAAAGFVFALRSRAPQGQAPDAGEGVVESVLSSAFSYVDTQSARVDLLITSPRRVFDHPQRRPGTRKRLQSVGRDFDPAPPDYLLAQGITRVKDAGMRVAITFDDGPSVNTTEVVRILAAHRVHATFFMVGRRVQPAQHLARAVVEQGSEIGNHTMNHAELWHMSSRDAQLEILDAEDQILSATGTRPVYVRPKGGEVDDVGIEAVKRLGKLYVYWDVAGFDTVPEFTAADIEKNVLEDVRPGSVILLHETNPRTVEALPHILDGLKRKGYQVQDLTELLAR